MSTIVSKCILIKIIVWIIPFVTRVFVQPLLDYKKLGQSFRPKEMNKFTLASSKVVGLYHCVSIIVFFFADVIIISQFIPVQNSCDPYPLNMCVIQKIYSIICITSYSSICLLLICGLIAVVAPEFQKKINEWTYALNVAGLQHLTVSENDDDKDCAICFETMKEATGLPCGHKFCDNCIKPWIKEKGTCPTCFQPAFSKKTTDLHVYQEGHKYVECEEKTNEHPLATVV
jgi:hypothetical protein